MAEFFLALPFMLYGLARLVEALAVVILALRANDRLRLRNGGTEQRPRLRPVLRRRLERLDRPPSLQR